MRLTIQLFYPAEDKPPLTKEFDFSRENSSFYLFDDFEELRSRPHLVSFGIRDESKAFVPGLMTIMLQKAQKKQIKIEFFQGMQKVGKIKFDGPEVPVISFYLIESNEEFLRPALLNECEDNIKDATAMFEIENSLVMYVIYEDHKELNKYEHTNLNGWKSLLTANSGTCFYYDPVASELVEVEVNTCERDGQVIEAAQHQMIKKNNHQLLSIRPFMTFVVKNASFGPKEVISNEMKYTLAESFAHRLTKVGLGVYERVRKCILRRHSLWMSDSSTTIAPIASICQYSGSGKSKLASEFTKSGLGVAIVLRNENEDAFPPSNNLSTELVRILKNLKVDSHMDLNNVRVASKTVTAGVLTFISSLVFKYFQEVADKALALDKSSVEEAVMKAIEDSGPKIPVKGDEAIPDYTFDTAAMVKFMRNNYKYTKPLTIENLAIFLQDLLSRPFNFLNKPCTENEEDSETFKTEKKLKNERFASICTRLSNLVQSFPFILVLDEAHLLADIERQMPVSNLKVTGFQLFRRAISYLKPNTPLFVLTLGTKSVILDMNPLHMDSFRGQRRLQWPAPVVLSGNFDVHRLEDGISYYDFNPTYQSLKNPIVFKMLASQGSPIWSSIPFSAIIDRTILKLRNSSHSKGEDVFVSWMIRTGMFANPKSAEAEELVAHRMADLFNLSEDMKTVTAFYPSQPILGIAARAICQEQNDVALGKGNIFQSLVSNSSLLEVDRGDFAESLAFMNSLLAIDKGKNVSSDCEPTEQFEIKTYLKLLIEIIQNCPKLETLWKKRSFILESKSVACVKDPAEVPIVEYRKTALIEKLKSRASIEEFPLDDLIFMERNFTIEDYSSIKPPTEFRQFKTYYHVTTVREFLVNLYGSEFEPYLLLFPESTLEGLVNASHFVKLPNGTSVDKSKNHACGLPLPNNLVDDTRRIFIDRALLKLGLTKQCAFALPLNYFGIDGIIPVCLNKVDSKGKPIYTFIAIQVKAGERINFEHVLKMQSRLHFVNCPYADTHASNEPESNCPYCSTNDELDEIFGNQIGLIISFDNEYHRASSSSLQCTKFSYSQPAADYSKCLKELYPALSSNSPVAEKLNDKAIFKENFRTESKSFCDTRMTHKFDINKRLRVFSCLWNESLNTTGAKQRTIDSNKHNTFAKHGIRNENEWMKQGKRTCVRAQSPYNSRQFKPINANQRLICLASHGFNAFQHLYGDPESSIEDASQILNPDWVIGNNSTVDLENMVAALLSESILPEYNECLLRDRAGLSSTDYDSLTEKINLTAAKSLKMKSKNKE